METRGRSTRRLAEWHGLDGIVPGDLVAAAGDARAWSWWHEINPGDDCMALHFQPARLSQCLKP